MSARTKCEVAIAAVFLCMLFPVLAGVVFVGYQQFVSPLSVAPVSSPTPVSANAENEYYRGVYDMCAYLYIQSGGSNAQAMADCNELERRAHESGWYELTSQGYEAK